MKVHLTIEFAATSGISERGFLKWLQTNLQEHLYDEHAWDENTCPEPLCVAVRIAPEEEKSK